ncbi:MAG TPA: D-2-hydroxyacid dehydrogenase [Pseudolysinimonas sp.]|nr:D-2-hydroxyacid dehydrogenase [Pseudolysinimonas sp.]
MDPHSRRSATGTRPPVENVLVTVPYSDSEIDQLVELFRPANVIRARKDDDEAIARALEVADLAVIEGDLDSRFLSGSRLQWVHCDHSGLNKTARPEVFDSGIVVTGAAGRSAPTLAQHVFYFALALTHDAPGLLEMQRQKRWRGLSDYSTRLSLWGKTLGIIGMGRTGEEVASLGRAFGMTVLGHRRSAAEPGVPVDRMYSVENGDTIDELLTDSDVVVLTAKLTDETRHMIGEEQLKLMKRSAYLINIARGPLIDEDALVDALDGGVIAGAGLDVFEQEPLPEDARIWSARNVLITPHVTPAMPNRTQRSIDIVTENYRRFQSDEPMLNLLTPADAYSHTPGDAT